MQILNIVTFFILMALGAVALGVQVWAFSDAVRTPAADFQRVYKRTKLFWAGLTGAATFFGILFLIGPSLGTGLILNLAASAVAGVYLADVRPKLQEVRGRGTQNRGSSW